MRLLLDTHVLIWLAEGWEELPSASRRILDREAGKDGLAVSSISFWETAMLTARGRIGLTRSVAAWRQDVLAVPGLVELPITGGIAIEAVNLPGHLHGDPADRILVATARIEGLRLGTRDARLLDYGRQGHVNTIAL